jgi:hypothetical protein
MDPVPPAPEASPLVRYSFAAVFIAACLYNLTLGVRVGGIFLLGMALYEGVLGRVPLLWFWQTTGYVRGPVAMMLVVSTIFIACFLVLAPDLVIHLLAMTQGLPDPSLKNEIGR